MKWKRFFFSFFNKEMEKLFSLCLVYGCENYGDSENHSGVFIMVSYISLAYRHRF
jgi:hypothetical protein